MKSRKAHVSRKWLLCMSFREAKVYSLSIPGHSSAFQASPTNPCLVRQVPAQLHQLSPYTLSSCTAATSLQTACLLPYYTRQHGGNLSANCMAACCFLPQTSQLPAQRSRHSSSLITGSMAETLLHGCPLHYRLAWLLVASSPPHGTLALLHPFKLHDC